MRYQNPQLREQLAAEYALGTLRGLARARFERLLRGDATLREEVTFWHERFSEFATRLTPVAPRDVVWTALEQTINRGKGMSLKANALMVADLPRPGFPKTNTLGVVTPIAS